MAVFVTLELSLTPEAVDTLIAQLPAILDETRQKPGFIAIDAYRHDEDANRIILSEQWESADAYRTYLQWRQDTGLFDTLGPMLADAPRVNIWGEKLLSVVK